MPHSVALLAALSGLGATAAHTKAEAGLDAYFLHASFADSGHAATNAGAVSSHLCAAPALLKVAGKAASDFFTRIFSGVKTVTARPSPTVCLSAGASPGVYSSPSVCTVATPTALGTSAIALKTSGSSHATTQLVMLKHHIPIERAAAGGSRLISDSFAAVRAGSARGVSGGAGAHLFSHDLPIHSAATAGPAAAAPAAAGAGAPTVAGAVASATGAAAKTTFSYKGAFISAQHKGMVLSKTATHGGHHAWKTRSSFFGRKSRGGSSRAAPRAQQRAAKQTQQRQKELERQQRRQQQQVQRQQRREQQQMQRQQRRQQQQAERERLEQQRARNREYRRQRAESREMYRQERDRMKQEQRQMRSLTRNELRMQEERERLAQARARGGGAAPYYSTPGYGATRPYGAYGGNAYGAPGGVGAYGPAGYYGQPDAYGGGYDEYGDQYGGDVGAAAGFDHNHNGGGYSEEAYGDHGMSPAGSTTQHVYAQPGGGEGLKSVTVIQDVAETKGGVTLHHVTETTSRARDVLAPQREETYAACCFTQLWGLTSSRVPRRALAAPISEHDSTKMVASRQRMTGTEGGGLGSVATLAATAFRAEAAGKAGRAARLTYTVVSQGCWVARTPLRSEIAPAAAAAARGDTSAAETKRHWTENGAMALPTIREEEDDEFEEGTDTESEGGGEETTSENMFFQIKWDACALSRHPFGSPKAILEPVLRLGVSNSAKGLQLTQQHELDEQLQRPLQLMPWERQQGPQQQRRQRSKRHSLWQNPDDSGLRLFFGIGEQPVHTPHSVTAEATAVGLGEALCRSVEETGRAGSGKYYEHLMGMETETKLEGGRHCLRKASEWFVTGEKVCAAETPHEEQYISATEASTSIGVSARTKKIDSSTATAAAVESNSQAPRLWSTKEGVGDIVDSTETAFSRALAYSSRAAGEPTVASKKKEEGKGFYHEKGGTLDGVGGREGQFIGQMCFVEVSSSRGTRGTEEGGVPGNDLSIEGETRLKEDSPAKAGGSRATLCGLGVQRPSASHGAPIGQCGALECAPEDSEDQDQRAVRELPWGSRQDLLRDRVAPVYVQEKRGTTPRREYNVNLLDGIRVRPTVNPYVKLNKAKRYVIDNWPSRDWEDWNPYRCYVRGSRKRYNIPQDLFPYKDELGEWHPPRLSARYKADVKKQYLINGLPWVWEKDFYEGKLHFADRELLGPKRWYRRAFRRERVKEALRKMDDLVLDYRQEVRERKKYNWFEKVVHDFAGEEMATQFIRKRREPKF